VRVKVEKMFEAMDTNKDGKLILSEAESFFKTFKTLTAKAMFNEVDVDGDKEITKDEWLTFWNNVMKSGYSAADVEPELESLMKGEAWVDWEDGRAT